jgi:DNA ligase (NAD+)
MLNANKVSLMKELILKIKDADKAYFVDDNPIMTDKEYDEMVEKLKGLEAETGIVFSGSPTKKVAGEVKKELKEVVHTKPMLSAQKTKSTDDIHRFIADKDVVVSWKLDGLTIVLRYQGGFLTKAVTRGRDGTVGEDVTDTVKYFRNVPRRIKETGAIEIRGEGVMSWNDIKF